MTKNDFVIHSVIILTSIIVVRHVKIIKQTNLNKEKKHLQFLWPLPFLRSLISPYPSPAPCVLGQAHECTHTDGLDVAAVDVNGLKIGQVGEPHHVGPVTEWISVQVELRQVVKVICAAKIWYLGNSEKYQNFNYCFTNALHHVIIFNTVDQYYKLMPYLIGL